MRSLWSFNHFEVVLSMGNALHTVRSTVPRIMVGPFEIEMAFGSTYLPDKAFLLPQAGASSRSYIHLP